MPLTQGSFPLPNGIVKLMEHRLAHPHILKAECLADSSYRGRLAQLWLNLIIPLEEALKMENEASAIRKGSAEGIS